MSLPFMRLLCITNLFPDTLQPWRGLDNATLLHAMKAVRPEADVRVLCMRPGHKFWIGGSCSLQSRIEDRSFHPLYHWAPYIPKLGGWNDRLYTLAVKRAMKKLPKDWQPDALLVPWLFPDACGVHRISEWAGLPMIAVAQGSDVHQYLHMPSRRQSILALSQRAKIVTRSEDLRQRLLKAGAPEQNVATIYNGVDIHTFYPGDKSVERQKLGLPQEGKMLLFVGNFLPVKGLNLLIQSVGSLKKECPLQLVLIGSGPLEQELKNLCESCGLGDSQVTFAGRKSPHEVAHYMRAADIVCLSSHNEGVPNVLLETFASGRAFVSTDVGGISEITSAAPEGGYLSPDRSVENYTATLRLALNKPINEDQLSSFAKGLSWPLCAEHYWQWLFASVKKKP